MLTWAQPPNRPRETDLVELLDQSEPERRVLVRTNSLDLGIAVAVKLSRSTWRAQRIKTLQPGGSTKMIGLAWRGVLVLWKDANVRLVVVDG